MRFEGAKRPDELPAYYHAADVFVGPSIVAEGGDTGGIPVSFMEAMASGCPVVASRVGGIGELIEDGVSGVLVDQQDPSALALAIHRVLTDEVCHARLANAGIARVEALYAQDRIADRYGALLIEVAA